MITTRQLPVRVHRASGIAALPAPTEVFRAWRQAQFEVDRRAREPGLAPNDLRTIGFLRPEVAERVADWYTGPQRAASHDAQRSYRALKRETAPLFDVVCRPPSSGGLGVRVNLVRDEGEPYGAAADLCDELRDRRSMTLTTVAAAAPHPLLGGRQGNILDQLRVVHDVFGHAALGVGFDLQSEFATWLQCRALFSSEAQGAAFCELVGATTTYIVTGDKPRLRADLPPRQLVAACVSDACLARSGLTP